jgi:hypothetical protein
MSLVLGRPIEPVTVMFQSQRVFFEEGQWLPAQCPSTPEQIEPDIMIGLAGPLAEALAVRQGHATIRKRRSRPSITLNEAIRNWLARGRYGRHVDDEYLERLRERTWNALAYRGCWEGVAAVAWALVYRVRLAPAEVERLFWNAAAAHQRSEAELAKTEAELAKTEAEGAKAEEQAA